MFVYQHQENEEKAIYDSNNLGCLLHFTMFGVDLKHAPKKSKIYISEDECEVTKQECKKLRKKEKKNNINFFLFFK